MDIKRITDPGEIATILNMDDPDLLKNVLNPSGCTKTEWVQFLMSSINKFEGNHLRIYGVVKDGVIKGYTVALNGVLPPMSRTFIIIYLAWKNVAAAERVKAAATALDKVKEWALENGCRHVSVTVKEEATARLLMKEGGFKKTDDICMELEF